MQTTHAHLFVAVAALVRLACCTLSAFDNVINNVNVSTVLASNLINAGLDWTPASFKCWGPRGPEGNKRPGVYSRKYSIIMFFNNAKGIILTIRVLSWEMKLYKCKRYTEYYITSWLGTSDWLAHIHLLSI